MAASKPARPRSGTPRTRPRQKPGPTAGAKTWTAMTDAHRLWGHKWVCAMEFGSNYAFAVVRAIRREDYPVPGGVDAWELKAVKVYDDDGDMSGSELWVKRKAKKK